jgi:hypothetical protein
MKMMAFLALLLLATAGCAVTGPVYTQPDLPPDQVALLEGDAPLVLGGLLGVEYRVSITEVDGQPAGQFGVKWDLKLLPGIHTVTLTYSSANRSGRPIPVRFDARAGHVYRAMAAVDGSRWIVWIEDRKTGEVVAGRKP